MASEGRGILSHAVAPAGSRKTLQEGALYDCRIAPNCREFRCDSYSCGYSFRHCTRVRVRRHHRAKENAGLTSRYDVAAAG